MSYARWGVDSDVYVFPTTHSVRGDYVTCCGCSLGELDDQGEDVDPFPAFYSPIEVVSHMYAHKIAGHEVPDELLRIDTYRPEDFNELPG